MNKSRNQMDKSLSIRKAIRFPGKPLLVWLLAMFSPLALAQHEMHDMAETADTRLQSMPANDEVLAAAPEVLPVSRGADGNSWKGRRGPLPHRRGGANPSTHVDKQKRGGNGMG